MNFLAQMAAAAWNIVPIFLILFLMGGIIFLYYIRDKIDEGLGYLRRIAESLERRYGFVHKDDDYK